ncbi:hypothetical protein VIA_000892 [Vibrio orientalis CIP 102891 = ATCC 33934]|uniref:Uncharacterized protein n=1 Tax=Vibrio orientalis CIP 102891 = ATCC 33934 TaxID=675816 RepID=A0ABP2H3D3_VIBOR|nr:hypothetical protein VIA_000892 [Vibrio orientalis CIP 102891 = ATCC 33934]
MFLNVTPQQTGGNILDVNARLIFFTVVDNICLSLQVTLCCLTFFTITTKAR